MFVLVMSRLALSLPTSMLCLMHLLILFSQSYLQGRPTGQPRYVPLFQPVDPTLQPTHGVILLFDLEDFCDLMPRALLCGLTSSLSFRPPISLLFVSGLTFRVWAD